MAYLNLDDGDPYLKRYIFGKMLLFHRWVTGLFVRLPFQLAQKQFLVRGWISSSEELRNINGERPSQHVSPANERK